MKDTRCLATHAKLYFQGGGALLVSVTFTTLLDREFGFNIPLLFRVQGRP